MVPRTNEGVEGGCSEAERLDAADVLDIDTVGLRALNLVERELVESFGLQLADVSGPDVVDGELIAAPEWQIVRVPQRLHLADICVPGCEREQARSATLPERPVERQRARLAAEIEADARGGELIVVGGQARELVDRKALAHVPVPVPVARSGRIGRGRGPHLEEHLPGANLRRPGAVNVGAGLGPAGNGRHQDQNGR